MPKLDPSLVVYEATPDPIAKRAGHDLIRCRAQLVIGADFMIDREAFPFPIPTAYKDAPLVPDMVRHRLRQMIVAQIFADAFHHVETMAHAIRGEQRPDGDRFGAVLAAADALAWIDEVRSGFIGEPT